MRIHSEKTADFIYTLANAIHKDPKSLEHWCCIHVENANDISPEWIDATLVNLKESYPDIECDVVHCADNDVLFISRHLHDEQICEMADELVNIAAQHCDKQGQVTLYDLYRDWKSACELLLTKIKELNITIPKIHYYNFGELSSVQDVFDDAKKLRKARFPLHVLIVEDDPLTLHIVTQSFKEHYALITATTAQEAVENYIMHAPDIVFLDIGLPDASGMDVLQQIMASDPDAYVVMFSANNYLDNLITALNHGASGFIAKPFKKEKMHLYIQDSAQHHRKSNI